MSTALIKNPQSTSQLIVESSDNPWQDKDMSEKKRGQVRVNFSPKFTPKWWSEVEKRGGKPGLVATQVLKWWLRQPQFVKDWAYAGGEGIDIPREAEETIRLALRAIREQDEVLDAELDAGESGKRRVGA